MQLRASSRLNLRICAKRSSFAPLHAPALPAPSVKRIRTAPATPGALRSGKREARSEAASHPHLAPPCLLKKRLCTKLQMIRFILFLTKSRGCPEDRLLSRKTGSKPDDRLENFRQARNPYKQARNPYKQAQNLEDRLAHSDTGFRPRRRAARAG